MQWQKSLGGSHDDQAYSIQQTSDGGYIVAGLSSSNDGDVSGNHGGVDYWIVKLDRDGNLEWENSLGGSLDDYAQSIDQTISQSNIHCQTATEYVEQNLVCSLFHNIILSFLDIFEHVLQFTE
jgi:hypothetical protein